MPIYEYKCSECGNVYEKRQKFSDPVDTVCNCERKSPVTRVTSAPALVFKGSGWYINDYARAGKGGNGKAEGESKGESAKADAGKGDSGKTDSGKSDSGKGSASGASSDSSSSSSSSASSESTAKPAPGDKAS